MQVIFMKKRIQSQSGVTLIELMITAVIIGLVAMMAVPRFQIAYDRLKYKGANRDMISTLKLARSLAITEKTQYGVHFDPDSKVITLFKDATPGVFEYDGAADSVVRADTLPRDFNYVATDMTNDVVFFRANGSADFDGGGNVHTMAYTEDVVALYDTNILASTGRVHSDSHYY
jgi:prepilin-type N-terminal cleavage/methylation domain-containing protein